MIRTRIWWKVRVLLGGLRLGNRFMPGARDRVGVRLCISIVGGLNLCYILDSRKLGTCVRYDTDSLKHESRTISPSIRDSLIEKH